LVKILEINQFIFHFSRFSNSISNQTNEGLLRSYKYVDKGGFALFLGTHQFGLKEIES
jgi:hypothetical protein